MVRMVLTEADWASIAHFFPSNAGKRGRPPKDHRFVLEGILWIHRTGAPWRDLPDFFGPWESIYTRFRRWTKTGLWDRIFTFLKKRFRPRAGETILIDATVIRAHQHAAGGKGGTKARL